MRKHPYLLTALLLLMGSAALGAPRQQVSIWVGMEPADTFQTLAKEFTAKTGIQVDITQVPSGDMRGQMINAAPVGQGPDLIYGVHDWIGELALSGSIGPITSKEFPLSLQKQHMPVSIEAFKYQNKLYGFPLSVETTALIYNKAMIKTPPKTMEELIDLAIKLTNPQKRVFGFLYNAPDFYFSYPIFKAYGGYIFKKGPRGYDYQDLGIANEGSVRALDFIKDLRFKYKLLPDGINTDVLSGLFAEGKCAMIFFGPWHFDRYRASGIDYGVAPLPTLNGKRIEPFIGVKGLMLNAQAKNRANAVKFARFLTTYHSELTLAKNERYVPSLMKVQKDPFIQGNPDLKGLTDAVQFGEPMLNVPEMNQVWQPLIDAANLVLSGKTTAAEALQNAKRVITQQLQTMQ